MDVMNIYSYVIGTSFASFNQLSICITVHYVCEMNLHFCDVRTFGTLYNWLELYELYYRQNKVHKVVKLKKSKSK